MAVSSDVEVFEEGQVLLEGVRKIETHKLNEELRAEQRFDLLLWY
jgi:hypothetical protein